jgi:hypothetical protein
MPNDGSVRRAEPATTRDRVCAQSNSDCPPPVKPKPIIGRLVVTVIGVGGPHPRPGRSGYHPLRNASVRVLHSPTFVVPKRTDRQGRTVLYFGQGRRVTVTAVLKGSPAVHCSQRTVTMTAGTQNARLLCSIR